MASRSRPWPLLIAACGIALAVIAMPSSWKAGWPSFLNPGFHLGLDLAGGTQLDFRISEDEIAAQLADIDSQIAAAEASGGGERVTILRSQRLIVEEQRRNLVEAIRTVLERRVNSLGVSEAVITPSYVGDEKHLLVECPGVVDTQTCIDTVGKTIQLEFKEEFTEATKEYEDGVRAKAQATLRHIRGSGTSLATVGQDMGDELGMAYAERQVFFKDTLPKGLESIWDLRAQDGIVLKEGALLGQRQEADGRVTEQDIPGVFLIELVQPRTQTGRTIQVASEAFKLLQDAEPNTQSHTERDLPLDGKVSPRLIGALRAMKGADLQVVPMTETAATIVFLRKFTPGKEQVDVSHVLVAYKGATESTVTRTKEEALARAEALKKRLQDGENFDTLARAESDGPSKQNGGKIGPLSRGQFALSFEQVAFGGKQDEILGPVETPFGYHVMHIDKAAYTTQDLATFDALEVRGENAEARANEMLAKLQTGNVKRMEDAITVRSLYFSLIPTGWKDTALDGKHFRTAGVILDPTTNRPTVQINFDDEGATLFQELTAKNVGKRIAIFVGGEIVTAPTVEQEITGGTAVITGSENIEVAQKLAQDLNTGAIPAPIHLSGQRTVEATLGQEALRTSVVAGFIGILVVMLYMLLVYRAFGVIASFALAIYAILFLALLKLPLFLVTNQYVVLTLAGAAGLILSIGMAVDTNVLVFERTKEELRKGKHLKTAVDIGYEKAWPSIRDSNISTLITCALLFIIGTSIVRGFAVTLGIGVLISMFTGIVVSRWMSNWLATSSFANKHALFPGMKSDVQGE